MKYYKLQDGAVVETSRYDVDPTTIKAVNKSTAEDKFLKMADNVLRNTPKFRFENGAFQLIWSNGTDFISESGVVTRGIPLCTSFFKSERDALKDSTFTYYASDEYRKLSAA